MISDYSIKFLNPINRLFVATLNFNVRCHIPRSQEVASELKEVKEKNGRGGGN